MPASTTQQSAPDDRATEFKAVDSTGEHYNGYTLMVEAYAAIWLILMAWFLFLWRKQANLTARVDGLEAALVRAEKGEGVKSAPAHAEPAKTEPAPTAETSS